ATFLALGWMPAHAAGNAAAYTAGVLASDPLAYWQLDAVGGQLSGADASGNGLNATPLGSGPLVSGLFGGAAAGGGN
ncbi:hypothetical protein OFC63_35425, partial [Escherichia coli]|nr:hypothetical protein [Escherichia coli]